jgi:peptidyl-prolyl cis-trans isomerase B (cyclophilin B)
MIVAAGILTAHPTTAEEEKPMNSENPQVSVKTSMGEIRLELNKEKAPVTVENFLQYVKDGYYDGTIFHRVIPNFMIQGGGFSPDMKQAKTRVPIKNEAANGLRNNDGTIAMARTSDVNSATAQFFINVKDNEFLNHTGNSPQGYGYAVFGKVIQGADVLKKIEAVSTGMKAGHDDVPNEPIVIESIKLIEAK